MLDKLQDSWRELKNAAPGERFQQRFHQRQKDQHTRWRKPLFIGGGILVMGAGLFFLPAPGPRFLILFLGGGLLAQESLLAARALDWTELRVRQLAAWGLKVWQKSPMPVKILLVLVGLALAAGAAILGYRLVFGR